jgi:hypothetical protein
VLDDPMMDPMSYVIATLRGDVDVQDLVGNDECGFRRIRGGEALGAGECANGTPRSADGLGSGHYRAFIVVATLDDPPWPGGRVPVQRALYSVACYGSTYQNARAVWGAVVKAIHLVGESVSAAGLGVYLSAIDSGGAQDKDPDTGQPLFRGTIRVIAATAQVV